jgi:hypothetical protein
MKNELERSRKILALRQVLEDHPEVFEGKAEALAVRENFLTESELLLARINQLVVPFRSNLVERIANRQQFDQLLFKMVNIGVLLARRNGDLSLQHTFGELSKNITRVSAHKALAVAEVVMSSFAAHEELLPALGVDPEARAQFEQLIADYQQSSREAEQQRNQRRNLKALIRLQIRNLNELIRMDLDRFVRYHASDYPLFAQRYQAIRRARPKASAPELPIDSDISGIVTNNLTGEALAGAVITLMEHAYSIETDAEGRYSLDELSPGSYTVSCHKPGYFVPEPVSFILTANDSVIHNFELISAESAVA